MIACDECKTPDEAKLYEIYATDAEMEIIESLLIWARKKIKYQKESEEVGK